MRALVVVNPRATTTSHAARDVLVSALRAELKVEVVETGARGHAAELATQATVDGLDYVVVFGGDGTVNEVVNGVLASGPRANLPAVAVVPGGSGNVFARALGLPGAPVDATGHLLSALRERRTQRIGLGCAAGRYFTFNAGLGFDAETVRRVEARRGAASPTTPWMYVRAATGYFFTGAPRRHPPLRLVESDGSSSQLFLGLVCNTTPWSYFGSRPVSPCPAASFDRGLDLFGLVSMRTLPTLYHLRQLLATRPNPHGRAVLARHDQPGFTIEAAEPMPFQMDGEYLGERRSVHFEAIPRALEVVL